MRPQHIRWHLDGLKRAIFRRYEMSFSIQKTLEKGIRGIIAGAVAVLASFLAKNAGIEITPEQQLALVAVVFGLIAALTNFLKHKFPKIFGWL